jgi:hypothetical protein
MKKNLLLFTIIIFHSCGVDSDIIENNNSDFNIKLLFPENNSETTDGIAVSNTENELMFKWKNEGSSYNSPYILLLTNLDNSETTDYESSETEIAIIIDRGVSYSWSVTGIANSSSEKWDFHNIGPWTDSTPPLPAKAISPVSGASISQTSTTVNLVWTSEDSDNDIIGHDLYFGETENPGLFIENITESRYDDIPVVAGIIYYWQVVTKDSTGNASTSSVFSFNVGS